MAIRSLIQQHKKKFLLFSLVNIVLSIFLILFYIHSVTTPSPSLPPAVGGDTPGIAVTETPKGESSFIFNIIFILAGLAIIGGFFFVIFKTFKKSKEEHPELFQ